jgi:hypothetical protein
LGDADRVGTPRACGDEQRRSEDQTEGGVTHARKLPVRIENQEAHLPQMTQFSFLLPKPQQLPT